MLSIPKLFLDMLYDIKSGPDWHCQSGPSIYLKLIPGGLSLLGDFFEFVQ